MDQARNELIQRLRGQTIIINDFSPIYNDYQLRSHPDIDHLRADLDDWMEKYIAREALRRKQSEADAALLSSLFWPRVTKDKLKILAYFCSWAFVWDDEVDCGALTNNDDGIARYCDNTVAFICSSMQPEMELKPPHSEQLHNSGTFQEIGEAMQRDQSVADRNRFVQAVVRFIKSVQQHHANTAYQIDSVSDYMTRRVFTSSIEAFVHTLVWAYNLKLPSWFWDHEATVEIVRETASTIAMYNDVVSLKKELDSNEVDSIIPILVYHKKITAQQAVDETAQMLAESFQRLSAAADRVRAVLRPDDGGVKRDVETWINGCVDLILGNMAWSLRTRRYNSQTTLVGNINGLEHVL